MTIAGRRRKRVDMSLPLHVKPAVVGSLNMDVVRQLEMPDQLRDRLNHACRWVEWSTAYDILLENLSMISRQHRQAIVGEQQRLLLNVGKLQNTEVEPVAFCNSFLREDSLTDHLRAPHQRHHCSRHQP
jgi:hypothetical protein